MECGLRCAAAKTGPSAALILDESEAKAGSPMARARKDAKDRQGATSTSSSLVGPRRASQQVDGSRAMLNRELVSV